MRFLSWQDLGFCKNLDFFVFFRKIIWKKVCIKIWGGMARHGPYHFFITFCIFFVSSQEYRNFQVICNSIFAVISLISFQIKTPLTVKNPTDLPDSCVIKIIDHFPFDGKSESCFRHQFSWHHEKWSDVYKVRPSLIMFLPSVDFLITGRTSVSISPRQWTAPSMTGMMTSLILRLWKYTTI